MAQGVLQTHSHKKERYGESSNEKRARGVCQKHIMVISSTQIVASHNISTDVHCGRVPRGGMGATCTCPLRHSLFRRMLRARTHVGLVLKAPRYKGARENTVRRGKGEIRKRGGGSWEVPSFFLPRAKLFLANAHRFQQRRVSKLSHDVNFNLPKNHTTARFPRVQVPITRCQPARRNPDHVKHAFHSSR